MEEERRLMYVACTRARDFLGLFAPETLFRRNQGSEIARPSPFVQELPANSYEEWQEGYAGGLCKRGESSPAQSGPSRAETAKTQDGTGAQARPSDGYCRHKIFGRGKILTFIPPNKYKVNFSGFGVKTMVADYLQMEDKAT
jgi:DNA helicase-2/ATP-dependent DNA helicase PcrA